MSHAQLKSTVPAFFSKLSFLQYAVDSSVLHLHCGRAD
jgi:hypothetical protein